MRHVLFSVGVVLSFFTCLPAQDSPETTQGTLYAVNQKGAELGACPLKRTRVTADISGFIARVKVVQEFENGFNEPIEAVYTFPLPQDAAVDDMTMKIGDRTIIGRMLKKEEARQVYKRAKDEGKTASLLDQERPNIFTQSVANIPTGENVYIEISYVQTLRFDDGNYEFVFPMTVAPRYIPEGSEADDAENISPPIAPTRNGHDISVDINLNAGLPIEEIRSNTHELQTVNLSPNAARVSLRNETTIPNKDLVLRYDVMGKRIEDSILATSKGADGFFSLILAPPERLGSADITPKEIVFVLDTSGSMSGFPIEKAKESMKMALEGLYPDDTFNLITFAGDTHILFEKPVLATQANLEKAQAFLQSRTGEGGTEMMAAIKAALAPSGSQDHVRIVCFMTDGLVGNDMEIIAEVKKHPKARVFSFGIGGSVNRFLLDSVAKEGRGEAEYILLEDDGSAAAKRFHERIRNPYLTDISIDWAGLPVTRIYPKRIPDLFGAKPLVIFGRYSSAVNGKIRLTGKIGGMPFERTISVNFPANEPANNVLASLWARTKIDELMSQSWNVETEEAEPTATIRNQIIKLGIDYRLMTQYTSFVAVEERFVTRTRNGKRIRVPVYAPAGTVFEDDGSGDGTGDGGGGGGAAFLLSPASSSYSSGLGSGCGQGSGRGSAPPPPPAALSRLPISTGVVNGKAKSLPKPAYPSSAQAVNASGAVTVQITVDESGKVISATPVSGHPLLRAAAQTAAAGATFAPTMLSGQPVKVTGVIVYSFSGNGVSITHSNMNPASEASTEAPATEEMPAEKRLKEVLHGWLYSLMNNQRRGEKTPITNEAMFVRDGMATVVIQVSRNQPSVIEKLEAIGVEVKSSKGLRLVAAVPVGKIADVAILAEVVYILPKL